MNWKKESVRDAYGKTLVELGKERKEIVVLDADLSSSTKTSLFARAFPDRFFNVGIAEQNLMSLAAGFAYSGKIPFASTFAVFATGRAYDQVRQSICYPNLKVRIVATHSGLTVGGDGASHQMCEDIGLMRSMPNIAIFSPCDAPQTREIIKSVVDYPGPVYVRLVRQDLPTLTEGMDFRIGEAQVLADGNDITLIATGSMVSTAILAASELKNQGISVRVINLHTIKPIDLKTIVRCARETQGIVTVEEHTVTTGLGAAVAEVVSEHCPTFVMRVGVPDTFGESGEPDALLEKYGLNVETIVRKAKSILEVKK
ncbi:MAG: transketolase family protein [Thermoplasmata archaeon]|nr:transketolase family protein [Thermoplasmata archaeon]